MAFDDFETSDGRPVELLDFANGAEQWHYTNANREVLVGATPYEPLAYRRTEPKISKDTSDARITLRVPGNLPVVALYTTILTSQMTTLTIHRFHLNDPTEQLQVFWKGQVGSVTRDDAMAQLLCVTFQEGSHEVPAYTYQSACNYFLFENVCGQGISREDFRHVGTVTSITDFIEIEVSGLRATAAAIDAGVSGLLTSGELDLYWQAGYVKTATEFRPVMQGNIGGDPDVVRINQPFRDLVVGQDIEVYAGCDRSVQTCDRKFNNATRFGGHPFGPVVNPFTTELPPGSRTSGGSFF